MNDQSYAIIWTLLIYVNCLAKLDILFYTLLYSGFFKYEFRFRGLSPRRYRSPPRAHGTGGNMVPLGPSRFNRSRSRSPRRRRSRS